eukprot:gene22335-biopygen17724
MNLQTHSLGIAGTNCNIGYIIYNNLGAFCMITTGACNPTHRSGRLTLLGGPPPWWGPHHGRNPSTHGRACAPHTHQTPKSNPQCILRARAGAHQLSFGQTTVNGARASGALHLQLATVRANQSRAGGNPKGGVTQAFCNPPRPRTVLFSYSVSGNRTSTVRPTTRLFFWLLPASNGPQLETLRPGRCTVWRPFPPCSHHQPSSPGGQIVIPPLRRFAMDTPLDGGPGGRERLTAVRAVLPPPAMRGTAAWVRRRSAAAADDEGREETAAHSGSATVPAARTWPRTRGGTVADPLLYRSGGTAALLQAAPLSAGVGPLRAGV